MTHSIFIIISDNFKTYGFAKKYWLKSVYNAVFYIAFMFSYLKPSLVYQAKLLIAVVDWLKSHKGVICF